MQADHSTFRDEQKRIAYGRRLVAKAFPTAHHATRMNNLEIRDLDDKGELLGTFLRAQGSDESPIAILEAGCGQRWFVRLDGKNFFLTGVDIDKDALEIRKRVYHDLDEAIHGDLRTVEFEQGRFDVVYSSFVLEHISGAEDVLRRMTGWLKPGGIIIVEIPDPDSVKGLITRLTPHWFHVLYYRHILGIKTAGHPGHGPYRTLFDPVISRRGIRDFCNRHGLQLEAEYAYATYGPTKPAVRKLIGMATKLVSVLSLGTVSGQHADLLYVLRRGET
jgi:SAM-dependent methyltransferase